MNRAASKGASKQNFFTKNRSKLPESHSHAVSKPAFKYVRGELIGKGSYGRVYLGLNAKTGEVMAIKQVELVSLAISQRQKEIIEAFKRENDMLNELDHENIVHYLGYEESPQYLSIFLEYIPGGTIKTCLNKYGRFREDVTKSLTSQVLSGLEYLHSKAIIHRDLKADNILLEQSGICKISDFGISKQVEDLQDIRAFTGMRGTVQWMAPEVVHRQTKERGYDVKVDIWSIGCLVLEMWTGELPWRGEHILSIMLKLAQKQSPPVSASLRLDPKAEQFRLLCFAPDPDDRPTATQLKAHEYLQLPPHWTFPYILHDGNAYRKSKTKSVRRNSFSIDPDAPPVPTLRPSDKRVPNNVDTHSQRQPVDTDVLQPSTADSDESTVQPCGQNNGPPVIRITPPSSPKERSFSYDEFGLSSKSSDTSEGTASSRRRRRRLLFVANPDEDSNKGEQKKYVFTPPPLPETKIRTSKSSLALHRPSFSESHPSRRFPALSKPGIVAQASPSPSRSGSSSSSTGDSSLSLSASHPHASSSGRRRETASSDDSETDDDLHLWNKPPVDLLKASHNRNKLASASSPSLARAFAFQDAEPYPLSNQSVRASRRSRMLRARNSVRPIDSWLVRPAVDEVWNNLDNFFPDTIGHAIGPEINPARGGIKDSFPAVQESAPTRGVDAPPQNPGPLYRMTKLFRTYSGKK